MLIQQWIQLTVTLNNASNMTNKLSDLPP